MNTARFTDIRAREARYAELLSQGLERQEIMRAMGLTTGQAAKCLYNIRKELGWQAQ